VLAARLETELKREVEVFKNKLLNNSTSDNSVPSLVCWSPSYDSNTGKCGKLAWRSTNGKAFVFIWDP